MSIIRLRQRHRLELMRYLPKVFIEHFRIVRRRSSLWQALVAAGRGVAFCWRVSQW